MVLLGYFIWKMNFSIFEYLWWISLATVCCYWKTTRNAYYLLDSKNYSFISHTSRIYPPYEKRIACWMSEGSLNFSGGEWSCANANICSTLDANRGCILGFSQAMYNKINISSTQFFQLFEVLNYSLLQDIWHVLWAEVIRTILKDLFISYWNA